MKAAFLLGRLVFGGFFLYNGINHIKQHKQLSQYAGLKNVPMPEQAVTGSAMLLLLGGGSILLGAKPKIGTAAVIAFLATAAVKMHDFWSQQDPSQRQNEMIHFSKNMALLGAAIALMGVDEPWPASVPLLK
ncbi:MAG: DoxX family membrane protein [Bryobacteraceae bacterium]|jgi:putative oxidoreductase